jgi:predicted tellurium resistance membrane protein TerC
MAELFTPPILIALATLTLMEIVLGIDNIVFLSILAGKLPAEKQAKARSVGLALALLSRLALLFSIAWVMKLESELFKFLGSPISGKDLVLIAGGLFLVWKATHEIYEKLEVHQEDKASAVGRASFRSVIGQIVLLDIVFSLDSVITGVGMVQNLSERYWINIAVIVVAMVVAVGVMLFSAGGISTFINRHPSMKILALSFLLLIGTMLVVEGLGQHVSKGYIYFAMAFSLLVELLNMRFRKRQQPVELHGRFEGEHSK